MFGKGSLNHERQKQHVVILLDRILFDPLTDRHSFCIIRNYFASYTFLCGESKNKCEGSFAIKVFQDLKIKKRNNKFTTIKIIENMCFQWKSMWIVKVPTLFQIQFSQLVNFLSHCRQNLSLIFCRWGPPLQQLTL